MDERIIICVAVFAKHVYEGAKITMIAKGTDTSQGLIELNHKSKKKLFFKMQRATYLLFLNGKECNRALLCEVVECVKKV